MNGGYLLFAGRDYYPGGGWEDHKETFATLEAAQRYFDAMREGDDWYWAWGHVVCDGQIVAYFGEHPEGDQWVARWRTAEEEAALR